MRWQPFGPYRIGVFRVFTRQLVLVSQALMVFFALFVCIIIGNWLLKIVKLLNSNSDVSYDTIIKPSPEYLALDEKLLSYGVFVDCGSSGSRVFVYCWPPHTGQPKQLLNIQLLHDSNGHPVVMKIEPGLSSYVDNPSDASEHVVKLLQYAAVHVPKERHKETPVYIMATAGLRLLDTRDQEAILNDLRVDLALQFNFLFSPTHVEVISGKQEGIYSWIAINHALGKFGHTLNPDDRLTSVVIPGGAKHVRKRTVGILDLGGASLQIVYEIPELHAMNDTDKNLLVDFNLGCSSSDIDHHYRLYVNTYLGIGSNEARLRYETQLLTNYVLLSNQNSSSTGKPADDGLVSVPDACLPVGRSEHIVRGNITAVFYGTGDFSECSRSLVTVLQQTTTCENMTACSTHSDKQRPIINFYDSEFYGFSEFFYTMEDILKIGGKYNMIKFQHAAQNYCSTNWTQIEKWRSSTIFPRADNNRYRLQCFKSAWLMTILHIHLGFPPRYRRLTSTQYISNEEVHWTLGALLYKTKYFPLRDIEKHQQLSQAQSHVHVSPPWTSRTEPFYYVIVFCLVILGIVVLLYIRRLRRAAFPLRRVPTMSYYMLDTDETSQSVRVDRSQSYSHLPSMSPPLS